MAVGTPCPIGKSPHEFVRSSLKRSPGYAHYSGKEQRPIWIMEASAGNEPNATHPRFIPALFTRAFGCTANGRPARRFLRHRQPLVQSSPSTHLRCVGLVQLTAIVAGSSEGRLYRVGGAGVSAGRRRRGGQSLRSRLPRWPHRAPTPPRPPSKRGRAELRRLLVRNEGAENAEILSRQADCATPSNTRRCNPRWRFWEAGVAALSAAHELAERL